MLAWQTGESRQLTRAGSFDHCIFHRGTKGSTKMSILKTTLRIAALSLVAGAALVTPFAAKASLIDGLSLRVGGFFPSQSAFRTLTANTAPGFGVEYKLPFVPKVFNGEHWSSSISADFYLAHHAGVYSRYIPISLNQVYTFEEYGGKTPYAGFALNGALVGVSGGVQPTVGRYGLGLIVGANFSKSLFLEGRYDWYDAHKLAVGNPEGFRVIAGIRF